MPPRVALPLRGCIAGLWHSPWSIMPVQVLGGGHINTGLGFVLTIQGVGASFSNAYGGLFAHHAGYSDAFFALAAAPCVGMALFIMAARFLPALRHALRNDAGF